MEKDERYKAVRILIEAGYFETFRAIFRILPKTVVCHDLGWKSDRFTAAIEDTGAFTLEDLYRIADLIGVEGSTISALVLAQRREDKAASHES